MTLCTSLLLALQLAPAPAETAPPKRLTLEQTVGRGEDVDFDDDTASWSWAEDGAHLERSRDGERRWIDPVTGEESEPPPSAREARRSAVAATFAALDAFDEERARDAAGHELDDALTEGGRVSLQCAGDEVWIVGAGEPHRLAAAESPAELLDLAPDGTALAFVRGGDLFVVDVASGRERALTSDGGTERSNGKLDWVYQEELYGRGDFKGFWWSPDSKHLAFLSLDESAVHDFTVVDHVEEGHFRGRPEVARYPKVGDPNPTVRLGLADVGSGKITWVDLSRFEDEEPLVVRVDWAPDGRLFFQVQNRIQTWLELLAADPASGRATTLVRETTATWVDRGPSPRFLADGGFLWLSARSGWNHVYRYAADGALVGALTSGEWEVRELEHVDEERGWIAFSASKNGATGSNVYRVGLDGEGFTRLTSGAGTHRVTFDPKGERFLDTYSSLTRPADVRLCGPGGEVQDVLERGEVPDLAAYAPSEWEAVTIRARDGFLLDAAILKPAPFDPEQRYAVWLPTYSGPDAPSVRDRWNSSAWYRFLAEQGYVVLQVNVRTASRKGQRVIGACYRQLGVQELADLEDAVDWLCAEPWADAERVGITGGSYGGFMTAYALTHSDRFALGIAGSGVYDWRMYDTIYTERYMSTPDDNPEGYAKTSVLEAAKDLQGHLVLTHGTIDDNVHLQNAMYLAYALQKADRPFELMLYPEARHGLSDPDQRWFAREMEWDRIQRWLGGPRGAGDGLPGRSAGPDPREHGPRAGDGR